jgi:hypothetical protein
LPWHRVIEHHIAPVTARYWESIFPKEEALTLLKIAGQYGVVCGWVSAEDGGISLDFLTSGLLYEELSHVSPDLAGLECAPAGGQIDGRALTWLSGFRSMEAHGSTSHPQHRVQASGRAGYLAGETLHGLAGRHDLARNLIRIWIQKFEAGAFDDEAVAADTIQAYEARIAALEGLLGR